MSRNLCELVLQMRSLGVGSAVTRRTYDKYPGTFWSIARVEPNPAVCILPQPDALPWSTERAAPQFRFVLATDPPRFACGFRHASCRSRRWYVPLQNGTRAKVWGVFTFKGRPEMRGDEPLVRQVRSPLKREWRVLFNAESGMPTADAAPHTDFLVDAAAATPE